MKVWQLVDVEGFLTAGSNDSCISSINNNMLGEIAELREDGNYYIYTKDTQDKDGDYEVLTSEGNETDDLILLKELPYFRLVDEGTFSVEGAEHFLQYLQSMGVIHDYDKEQLVVAIAEYKGAK